MHQPLKSPLRLRRMAFRGILIAAAGLISDSAFGAGQLTTEGLDPFTIGDVEFRVRSVAFAPVPQTAAATVKLTLDVKNNGSLPVSMFISRNSTSISTDTGIIINTDEHFSLYGIATCTQQATECQRDADSLVTILPPGTKSSVILVFFRFFDNSIKSALISAKTIDFGAILLSCGYRRATVANGERQL
jgi:hypothetical protein